MLNCLSDRRSDHAARTAYVLYVLLPSSLPRFTDKVGKWLFSVMQVNGGDQPVATELI